MSGEIGYSGYESQCGNIESGRWEHGMREPTSIFRGWEVERRDDGFSLIILRVEIRLEPGIRKPVWLYRAWEVGTMG